MMKKSTKNVAERTDARNEEKSEGGGDRLDRRVENVTEHALGRLRDVRRMLTEAGREVPARVERAIVALEDGDGGGE